MLPLFVSGVNSGSATNAADGLPRLRILIVEDEYLIACECEWILADADHEVLGIAANEQDALSLAADTQPDLALVDIRLARGDDGIRVAREMLERWAIRSIFVSAHGEQEVRSRSLGADPVGWLVKPYTAVALINAIERAAPHLAAAPSGAAAGAVPPDQP